VLSTGGRALRDTAVVWAPTLLVASAAVAGAVWYAWPEVGGWPLLGWGALWLVAAALTGRWWTATPYDIPLACLLLTACVAVLVAFDRQAAWGKYWTIVGGLMLFYAVAHLPTQRHRRAFAWAYALFGAGIAGYFFWTNDWDAFPAKVEAFVAWGTALQARLPYLPGHRLHPNVVGGLLAAIVPFQVWAVASSRRGRWQAQLAGAGALLLSAAALVMTASRGAWLGLVAAGGLWALVRARRWAGWALLLLVVGMVGGAAVALVLLSPEALPFGMSSLLRIGDRGLLLEHAVWLMQDYPYTGGGLGGFQLLHSTYILALHVGHTIHSHNLFLDIGVEQGIPGLISFLALVVLSAVQVWRSRGRPGLAAAAAVGWGAMLVHGFVEDALYGSRGVLLLFVPLGLFIAPASGLRSRAAKAHRALAPAAAVVLAAALLLGGRTLLAAGWANLGTVMQSQAELSVYHYPGAAPRDVRPRVDLEHAVGAWERALALAPGDRTACQRLGMLRYEQGDYGAALELLQQAYAASPRLPATREFLAYTYVALGQPAKAAPLLAGPTLGPTMVDKMLWEAKRAEAQGDRQRAADAYRAVLLYEPDAQDLRCT
jgi:hypothetical protein